MRKERLQTCEQYLFAAACGHLFVFQSPFELCFRERVEGVVRKQLGKLDVFCGLITARGFFKIPRNLLTANAHSPYFGAGLTCNAVDRVE